MDLYFKIRAMEKIVEYVGIGIVLLLCVMFWTIVTIASNAQKRQAKKNKEFWDKQEQEEKDAKE